MSTIERPQAPEQRTIDVDVESLDTRGRTVHGYAAVYDVAREDLGGFREKIAPGAFAGVLDADVARAPEPRPERGPGHARRPAR